MLELRALNIQCLGLGLGLIQKSFCLLYFEFAIQAIVETIGNHFQSLL